MNWKSMMLVFAVMIGISTFAPGEDPVKAAPNNYKQLFENEKIRAYDVVIKPGDKVASHSHPNHFAYAMAACSLTLMPEGGEPQEAKVKAGEIVWLEATTHSAENKGMEECHFLVVDLKEAKAGM